MGGQSGNRGPPGSEGPTDDLVKACPVRSNSIILRELIRLIEGGQQFFDPYGNELETIDEIAETLRRFGRVLGPPIQRLPADASSPSTDPEGTAVIKLPDPEAETEDL
jgi:hypothetical protein